MSYTPSTLATFMVTELSATGVALSLTDGSDAIDEAVNEVAAVLGVAIADETNDLKLRAIARWQAWLTAEAAATGQYDLSSEGDSFKRSQMFANIQSRLARAEAAASVYSEVAAVLAGSGGVAYVTEASGGPGNPYQWPRDEWSA